MVVGSLDIDRVTRFALNIRLGLPDVVVVVMAADVDVEDFVVDVRPVVVVMATVVGVVVREEEVSLRRIVLLPRPMSLTLALRIIGLRNGVAVALIGPGLIRLTRLPIALSTELVPI
jgi:hypothetical protein